MISPGISTKISETTLLFLTFVLFKGLPFKIVTLFFKEFLGIFFNSSKKTSKKRIFFCVPKISLEIKSELKEFIRVPPV